MMDNWIFEENSTNLLKQKVLFCVLDSDKNVA